MFSQGNLSRTHRSLRMAAGICLTVLGILGRESMPLMALAILAGAILFITGLVRYCPACAIAEKNRCNR
jgi:uncharacterized membrane protein HdeD (DUF308 family)